MSIEPPTSGAPLDRVEPVVVVDARVVVCREREWK